MLPTLKHDDFVISRRNKNAYKINDIIVLKHPEWGCIIKRVLEYNHHEVLLCADNPNESLSTERMGWQKNINIIGRVVYHISPH